MDEKKVKQPTVPRLNWKDYPVNTPDEDTNYFIETGGAYICICQLRQNGNCYPVVLSWSEDEHKWVNQWVFEEGFTDEDRIVLKFAEVPNIPYVNYDYEIVDQFQEGGE